MKLAEHSGAWNYSADLAVGIGEDVAYPLDRIGATADIAAVAVCLANVEGCMIVQNLQVNGRRNPMKQEIKGAVQAAASKWEHVG